MYSYLIETLTDVFSYDLRFDPKIRKDTAVRVSLSFYSIVKQPHHEDAFYDFRQNVFRTRLSSGSSNARRSLKRHAGPSPIGNGAAHGRFIGGRVRPCQHRVSLFLQKSRKQYLDD